MKYRVNWTEYHEVELEADNEAEARELSKRMSDTRKTVYAHEVHPASRLGSGQGGNVDET